VVERLPDLRSRRSPEEAGRRCAKQHSKPGSDKRGTTVDELHLSPLDLIERIAALEPPPRTDRHRYLGVLAPNSPHRAAAVALAAPMPQATAEPAQPCTGVGAPGVVVPGNAVPTTPKPVPPKPSPAHYLWAVLIASFLRPCGTDRSDAQRTSSDPN